MSDTMAGAGADFNAAAQNPGDLFEVLANAGQGKGVKVLADYLAAGGKFDQNQRGPFGFTQAMAVAHYAGADGLMMMVLAGANLQVNVRTDDGRTILNVVHENEPAECLSVLEYYRSLAMGNAKVDLSRFLQAA